MSGLQLKPPRKLSQKTSIPPSKSYKSYRKTDIIPKTTLHRWKKIYGDKIPEYLFNQQCHSNKSNDKVSRRSDTADKCGQVWSAHSSASSFTTQRVFEGIESFVIPECSGEDMNLASEQADADQGEEEQEKEVKYASINVLTGSRGKQ
ncbi:Zinc finger protein 875 [Frankliniella fusca]|uniref:Zinc finger protein 875 n=1 Tax=Frankliniella fusca TaxID=407009 RepID=A0AAE1L5U0_9NEOP|nr:Zinc finger protein 875 [Frankliniella fusca]